MITFWVPGVPVGVPRPKAQHIDNAAGGFTHIYTPTPPAFKLWRQTVHLMASLGLNRPAKPLDGPIRIDLTFVMPRPQCYSRKKDHPGIIWAPSNPNDWDNLGKITDVCTKLGYWRDDRQVCDARVRKCFNAVGGQPGALLIIDTIEGLPDELPRELPGVGVGGMPVDHADAAVGGRPGEPVDRQGRLTDGNVR